MVTKQKKSVKAGKRVSTAHVDSLIRNYKQERWSHNSRRIGKEDSLSVWYSIEELEEFMATVKKQGGDGIKLYFGVYDENQAPQKEYVSRQTIVLVATKEKETPNGLMNKNLYVSTENGSSILAYNAGSICPPYCSGNDGFGGLGITIVDKGSEGLIVA